MSDIVELARERRARLLAEMAKLDDFIQLAETLVKMAEDDGAEGQPESEGFSFSDEFLPETDQFLLAEAETETAPAEADTETEADEDELLLTDAVADSDARTDAHVGMRIRHRRWMMGIAQEELARLTGMTAGQIQRFEAGDSSASARQLRELAAAMKVPMSFFLEGLPGDQAAAAASRDANRPEK